MFIDALKNIGSYPIEIKKDRCGILILLFVGVVVEGNLPAQAAIKEISSKYGAESQEFTNKSVSQKLLKKLMADIRECDKNIQYEYDTNTKQVNPPELKAIKGFKFHKLLKNELSFFKINETYEGMHASMLVLGQKNGSYGELPTTFIYFDDNYESVKKRLESVWNVHFNETTRPGPDDYSEGKYAELKVRVKGVKKFEGYLSIEKMPKDVYPYIGLTQVGCDNIISSTD